MIPFYDYLHAVNRPPWHRRSIVRSPPCWTADKLILGPLTAAFEDEFARFCGTRNAVGVGNGLDALTLIMRAFRSG